MGIIINILVSMVAVFASAYLLRDHGVTLDGWRSAFWLSIVLGVLNVLVRPILVVLTIPITLVTFGLFLLVINALMIMLASALMQGFSVKSFGIAFVYSILVSVATWVIDSIINR